jgi:hypothetical protein
MRLIKLECSDCSVDDQDLYILESEFDQVPRCKNCSISAEKEHEEQETY